MKILNLYSGIGGNRKLWNKFFSIRDFVEVTAIENDPKLAEIYQNFFPNDTVLVTDAHEYLRQHYKEFDFIWSSPPCQTHSSFRHNICVRYRGTEPKFPDMTLYEEILFLKHHFKGKWVVENVKPYYKPLMEPTMYLDRHLFWANFMILPQNFEKDNIRKAQIPQLQKKYGFDLKDYKLPNKRQILRNCVEPEIGLYILQESMR